ncbi:MAG TPA: cytochrome c [Verrucomicrobiae bacterium]|nr:cytochrome c [Verrucomicrobiae bacterium]
MSVEQQHNPSPTMDEAEPREGWAPVPVLLIGLLALLLYWGFTRLDDKGGGFEKNVYPPYVSLNQEIDDWPVDIHGGKIKLGQKLFDMNCAPCHMTTGVGNPAVGAPPLAGSDWVNAEGPNRVIRIVLNGLQGPIEVSGNKYGTGVMLPWRDVFKDDQIAAILSYVRENKEWGNKASEVMDDQVAKIRKETESRGKNWSPDELLKIPVK